MEDDMFEYLTLRTKDLGQGAPSADRLAENARAKAVRASFEFWSTGDEALLEQAFAETFDEQVVRPLRESATKGFPPSGRAGVPKEASK
jgi:hypothetical protein